MDILQGLRRAVQLSPSGVATLDGETAYTWREFDDRTQHLAAALSAKGINRGDRVAILMLNGHRYLELYYGLARLGALCVPLNIRLAPPEVTYILNDSESAALVVDDVFLAMARSIRSETPTLRHFIYAGQSETPDGFDAYEALLKSASVTDWQDATLDTDDLAGIFYTGGTTGKAKGVMLSQGNLVTNAYHTSMHATFAPDEIYLHAAPMFHLADCCNTFAITNYAATHAFIPAFDPRKTIAAIEKYHVTRVTLVPTMINAIINMPDLAEHDLSSLRFITYGASPIAPDQLKRAFKLLNCQFGQGYGQTEAAPLLTFLSPEDHVADGTPQQLKRLTSCGRALIGVDLRVVDITDQEVPRGAIGEIVARGPNVMRGYWKLPDESANSLRNGWLHTGDLGIMDEDGYIFLVDRAKDMIVSGGENVYSVEVENALYHHPAVLEAAVIGVPDDRWGERVHAVVALKPGMDATADELIAICHESIAGYKCPRTVEFVDMLPKSGAGKILKRTLRDAYWHNQTRQIH